jgi:hypothetical protein
MTSYDGNSFQILNTANKNNPSFRSELTTGTPKLVTPSNVVIDGVYAYVASYYDNSIEVLDITDPMNPIHT